MNKKPSMIDKERVVEIAEAYLIKKKREFLELGKSKDVQLVTDHKALYGKRAGEILDTYTIPYSVAWGFEAKAMFIKIDAITGEVLYSIGPTSWIEELDAPAD